MLEIMMLIALTKSIGKVVEGKGRPSGKYKALAVALWIGGEILGFIIGEIAELGGASYVLALLGAATGAFIAWRVAASVPALEPAVDARVFD